MIYFAGNRIVATSSVTKPENVTDGTVFYQYWGDPEDWKVWIRLDGEWEEDISGAIALDEDIFEIDNGELTIKQSFIDSLAGLSDHSELNLDDGTNPHGTTKADVGLGNVTDDVQVKVSDKATQTDAETGTDNDKWMTPLRVKQAIDEFASASGEANTASNVGGAVGLFLEKVGVDLRFRTIEAGSNVTFDLSDPNKVVINASGGGGGGINAISNLGSVSTGQTINGNTHRLAKLTATANIALTLTDGGSDFLALTIQFGQDSNGTRTVTSWNGEILFPGGIEPQPAQGNGVITTFHFEWNGDKWLFINKTEAQS